MDLREIELEKPGEPPPEPPRRYPWLWVGLGIVVVLLAIGYVVTSRRGASTDRVDVSEVTPTGGESTPSQPLGGDAAAVELPPLDESDPIVRDLVRKLTTHPTALAWLAGDNLVRAFVATTQNIAGGVNPSAHVRRLAPSGEFAVIERDGATHIDPRSYARYDRIADAVASVDPQGAADLYATLKPRLTEAHDALGTGRSLDQTLEEALVRLLRTPVLNDPVRVVPKGVGYAYADPALENLTPPQKQLMRMGPRNTRIIQDKLREIATALGIDANRLPPPAAT